MRKLIIGLLLVPAVCFAQASGTGYIKRSGGEAAAVGTPNSSNQRQQGVQAGGAGIGIADGKEIAASGDRMVEAYRREGERKVAARQAAAQMAREKHDAEMRKMNQEFRAREAEINRQAKP
jgi:hypothetical protein